MEEPEGKTETKETKPKKPKEKKVAGLKTNTIDMTLVNGNGQIITAKGNCSDLEIKSLCRAISNRNECKIEIV